MCVPLELTVTQHLGKVADTVYRCSSHGTLNKWFVQEGNSQSYYFYAK